jgi:hypothetical protein
VIFQEKEIAIKVAKGLVLPNILDYLPMTSDYEIVGFAPPPSFIGKTLEDLALPHRFRVQVIAIKELIPENFRIIAGADFVVKDSDILVILGKMSDIERLGTDRRKAEPGRKNSEDPRRHDGILEQKTKTAGAVSQDRGTARSVTSRATSAPYVVRRQEQPSESVWLKPSTT